MNDDGDDGNDDDEKVMMVTSDIDCLYYHENFGTIKQITSTTGSNVVAEE